MTIALFSSLMCPWTPFIRTKANRDLRRAFKINLNVYFLIANHIFQVKLKHPKKFAARLQNKTYTTFTSIHQRAGENANNTTIPIIISIDYLLG